MAELSELAHFIWWKMCKARFHLDSQQKTTLQIGESVEPLSCTDRPSGRWSSTYSKSAPQKGCEIPRPGTKCGDSDKTQMNYMLTPDLMKPQLGGGSHLSGSNLSLFWGCCHQIYLGLIWSTTALESANSQVGTLAWAHWSHTTWELSKITPVCSKTFQGWVGQKTAHLTITVNTIDQFAKLLLSVFFLPWRHRLLA